MTTATILHNRFLTMQVCVPKDWSDEDVTVWANRENPSGTSAGWVMCKEGDDQLVGDPERVQCQDCEDNVHILMGC